MGLKSPQEGCWDLGWEPHFTTFVPSSFPRFLTKIVLIRSFYFFSTAQKLFVFLLQSQDAHGVWICPWRSNHAAVTSAPFREPWNRFSWKSPLKSSSQTTQFQIFHFPGKIFQGRLQGQNQAKLLPRLETISASPSSAHQASQRGFGRGPCLQTRLSSWDSWMWGETDNLLQLKTEISI